MSTNNNDIFTLNTDGGARGNPGPAAGAAVIKDNQGSIVKQLGKYLGTSTNNDAEYQALIMGVELAKELGIKKLKCILDSELVVKQLNGEYKVKIDRLKVYFGKIKSAEKDFDLISYEHVRRESNKEADALVNQVLDALSL